MRVRLLQEKEKKLNEDLEIGFLFFFFLTSITIPLFLFLIRFPANPARVVVLRLEILFEQQLNVSDAKRLARHFPL